MASCTPSVFNGGTSTDKYIKFLNGDLVAIEGKDTLERMILGDLVFRYKDIYKTKLTLKKGEENYLLNNFEDKITFLSISARYDPTSKIDDKNFVRWNWTGDGNLHTFNKLLLLTTNKKNPFRSIYLHNPNLEYGVQIEVMVASSLEE